jgi:glycosyltransferase involved in cell wall biosynthesis
VRADAVVLSYRLGGTDGVSVEADKWAGALRALDFAVRRVAGEVLGPPEPADVVLSGLAIDAPGSATPEPRDLRAALDGAALVVVENICSLPLNPPAARAVAAAVAEHPGRVLFHHHDLAWQRRGLDHLADEFPPRTDGALHVTINHRSRRELEARGFTCVTTIANRFALDAPLGAREPTRGLVGFGPDDLVLFQPARAIERKNVPGGLRYAARLATLLGGRPVRYWLAGPAEDGYGPTLARLLERSPVPVTVGHVADVADAYAAADVVMLPSTWEGFGNATIESVWARRPLVAYEYPVLAEITACGLRSFPLDEPERLARFLARPDESLFEVNLRRARRSFSLDGLPAAIEEAFASIGWTSW